jgi:transcriptional regulator with GAF, ATPase, and Fis domain
VLFLDEIGELDLTLQAKLLRVLQDGYVLAVGNDRDVKVNVRVLAATNRDLEAMVGQGAFRADLYHRLNVVAVRIPPLRDRPEDIALLVEHFVAKHSALLGLPPIQLEPERGVDPKPRQRTRTENRGTASSLRALVELARLRSPASI